MPLPSNSHLGNPPGCTIQFAKNKLIITAIIGAFIVVQFSGMMFLSYYLGKSDMNRTINAHYDCRKIGGEK